MNLRFEIEKLVWRSPLSASVRRDYDDRRGYARHHEASRAARQRPLPVGCASDLVERGFVRSRAIPGDDAAELCRRLEQSAVRVRRGRGSAEVLRMDDSALQREVLERVLTPEIDRQLLHFFGSEYVPYWCVYNRTAPERDSRRSFLWHCDKGPSAYAKLLVNLSNASETGGCTQLLDPTSTRAFDEVGYVFRGQSDRLADLAEFARRRGLPFEPVSVALEAGESLLFLPRDVLHRGLAPERGISRRLHVTFLPSPTPWRVALEQLEATPPLERAGYAWPRNADALTRCLAPPARAQHAP